MRSDGICFYPRCLDPRSRGMSGMNGASMAERILVIDDEESNIHVLSSMLGQQGFEIASATEGEQALRSIAARPPDLVLLDVLMPGIDGFEVCRRIREH